jgi:hypothetical protein
MCHDSIKDKVVMFDEQDLVGLLKTAVKQEGGQSAFAKHHRTNSVPSEQASKGVTRGRRRCKGPGRPKGVCRRIDAASRRPGQSRDQYRRP